MFNPPFYFLQTKTALHLSGAMLTAIHTELELQHRGRYGQTNPAQHKSPSLPTHSHCLAYEWNPNMLLYIPVVYLLLCYVHSPGLAPVTLRQTNMELENQLFIMV